MYHLHSVIVHKILNITPSASVISSHQHPIPFFLWYLLPMLCLGLAMSVSVFWTPGRRTPLQYHTNFLNHQKELQYSANSGARGLDEMPLNFFKYVLRYKSFMKPHPGNAPSELGLEFASCWNWCPPPFRKNFMLQRFCFCLAPLYHTPLPGNAWLLL